MKSSTSPLHRGVLDKERWDILHTLIPFTADYILSGGTGLALQIGHRKSFDFDFFTPHEISPRLIEKLSSPISIATVSVNSSDELTFFTDKGVKISCIFYPFNGHFTVREEERLRLFTPESIALQKAYTIGRRGEYRDYFDLYSLLHGGYTNIPTMINSAQKVYKSVFNEKLFLEQLVYFADFTTYDIIPVEGTLLLPQPQEVKTFLEQAVSDYMKTHLS